MFSPCHLEQRPEAVPAHDVEVRVGVLLVQPLAAQPAEVGPAPPARDLEQTLALCTLCIIRTVFPTLLHPSFFSMGALQCGQVLAWLVT